MSLLEASSVQEMRERFQSLAAAVKNKRSILRDAIFLEDHLGALQEVKLDLAHCKEMIGRIKEDASELPSSFESVKDDVEKGNELNERMRFILNNLPPHFPKMGAAEVDVRPVQHNGVTAKDQNVATKEQEKSGPTCTNTLVGAHNPPQKSKPVARIKLVSYFTTEEFEKLPKYVRGRQTMKNVNTFIQDFNRALQHKYDLLSKVKGYEDVTRLSMAEMKKYKQYKSQEVPETKGSTFVVAEDIHSTGKSYTGSNLRNMLTMLRVSKKMKEMRTGGEAIRYVVLG